MAIKLPLPLFDVVHTLKAQPDTRRTDIVFPEDFQQAHAFLYGYRNNEATFNAYRREIERFLHWCWLIVKKPLPMLRRLDIEQYIEFCQNPPSAWIGLKKVPRFIKHQGQCIPNPVWRPFVVTLTKTAHRLGKKPKRNQHKLSQKAIREIFTVLSSFLNYCVQEGYLEFNPVLQVRQKSRFLRKSQAQSKIRRLSDLQWFYVLETAEQMAATNTFHERTLFIMNALYGLYLRISELAASPCWLPKMGDFYRDQDGNWWFTTVGKGNKERQITVSDAMLNALKRYRKSLKLPLLPLQGETTPLLLNINGKDPITSTRHIRTIVQTCFDAAILRLKEDHQLEEAEQLQGATVHWLRHTGISDDVKHRPREHVRDDAGHSSSAITDKYIDVELRARHASGKKKLIKPDL